MTPAPFQASHCCCILHFAVELMDPSSSFVEHMQTMLTAKESDRCTLWSIQPLIREEARNWQNNKSAGCWMPVPIPTVLTAMD
jgi:hypothetical protein